MLTPDRPPTGLDIAHCLLMQRQFDEAAPLYLRAINETPAFTPAWEGLFASLAGIGLGDKALALVETRQQRFNDGLAFYLGALTRVIASGLDDVAETAIAATPGNSLLTVVARYAAGIIALHRDQPQEAAAHLGAAGTMAENFVDHFSAHPMLRKIIIEGRQFQDFAALDVLLARDRETVMAETGIIETVAHFADSSDTAAPFVLCAGMNEHYLDRFGLPAVTAVAAALTDVSDATFHLHIVDPTPQLGAKIDALRAAVPSLRLGLSTETYHHTLQGYGRATYYACARFVRAPEIMAHYRKPLMVVDIDIDRIAHVPQIMTGFAGGSYGCFERHAQLPSLICHCSILAIGNDPAAVRFADLGAKLIARRTANEPYWGLDQTSILVASRFLTAHDPAFRRVELAAATGFTFDDCFVSLSDAAEKQSMRKVIATAGEPEPQALAS